MLSKEMLPNSITVVKKEYNIRKAATKECLPNKLKKQTHEAPRIVRFIDPYDATAY